MLLTAVASLGGLGYGFTKLEVLVLTSTAPSYPVIHIVVMRVMHSSRMLDVQRCVLTSVGQYLCIIVIVDGKQILLTLLFAESCTKYGR